MWTRRFLSVVGTIWLLSQATGLASDQTLYEEAVTAFKRADYELAAGKFGELVEQSPNWAPGHLVLGQCLYLSGQAERGDESILRAHELDPATELFKAYLGIGQTLEAQKRFDQAVRPLEKALEHAPTSQKEPVSLRLSLAYLAAGQYEPARRAFEGHRDRFGTGFETVYHLALACQKLGDYECALDNLREAKRVGHVRSEDRKVLEYLAEWSRYRASRSGNLPHGEEILTQAVEDTRHWYEAEPKNTVALRHHAGALLAADREQELIRELVPLARRDPRNCTARMLLAEAFNSLDEGEKAEVWAKEATECDPSLADAHIELAVAVIRQIPADYSTLGQVKLSLIRIQQALSSLQEARRLESRSSQVETLLAAALSTKQRLRQAEGEFVANNLIHDDAVQQAQAEVVRQRCQNLWWSLRDDSQELSVQDAEYYEEHGCEQYVAQSAGGGRER